jgi:hypothetical protein
MIDMLTKPRMVAAEVPWQVAVDAPFLELVTEPDGTPRSATFTAYFKRVLREGEEWLGGTVTVVREPSPFRPAKLDELGEYHRVRLRFLGGVIARLLPSRSESEDIDYQAYDWSGVPAANLQPGESVEELLDRRDRYFLATGLSANPRFYIVENTSWLAEEAPGRDDLHHYVLLGDETYLEVIAAGWEWDLGQVVD